MRPDIFDRNLMIRKTHNSKNPGPHPPWREDTSRECSIERRCCLYAATGSPAGASDVEVLGCCTAYTPAASAPPTSGATM